MTVTDTKVVSSFGDDGFEEIVRALYSAQSIQRWQRPIQAQPAKDRIRTRTYPAIAICTAIFLKNLDHQSPERREVLLREYAEICRDWRDV